MAEFIRQEEDSQEAAKPSPAQVIRQAFDAMAMELRVSMPAQVLRYDHKTQLIDAKPFFKRKYKDGTVEAPPVIYNVPVDFQRAGKAFIALPLEPGHVVQLMFSDRSFEKWLSSGGEVDPDDSRAHHISDCHAIPGGYPISDPAKINNAKDLIIKNDDGKGNILEIRLKKNNHLQVINKTDELVKVLNDMLQVLREARTPTCGGPQPLIHTKFPEITRRLKTFQEK